MPTEQYRPTHMHTHVLLLPGCRPVCMALPTQSCLSGLQQSSTVPSYIHWPSCPGWGTSASLLQTASECEITLLLPTPRAGLALMSSMRTSGSFKAMLSPLDDANY